MARILVIDDDPYIRALVRQLLEPRGYAIVEADEGDHGLDLHRQEPVDLVITDIVMQGKEGLATIREFRSEFPHVKIIAMSGGGITGIDYLPLAKDLGASHVFGKPFKVDELQKAVQDLLEEDP